MNFEKEKSKKIVLIQIIIRCIRYTLFKLLSLPKIVSLQSNLQIELLNRYYWNFKANVLQLKNRIRTFQLNTLHISI